MGSSLLILRMLGGGYNPVLLGENKNNRKTKPPTILFLDLKGTEAGVQWRPAIRALICLQEDPVTARSCYRRPRLRNKTK